MSPKNFSRRLRERLLDLHWRQWSTLGVAGQEEYGGDRALDLEALTVSTLALRPQDQRLTGAMLEWLSENGSWVNRSRLGRVAGSFAGAGPGLLPGAALDALGRTRNGGVRRRAPTSRRRQIVSEPRVRQPALIQLSLRSLFGVDARADVFLYLLCAGDGNSLSIARAVCCDQKSAYTALERWVVSGVVARTDRGYSLVRKDEWRRLLNLPPTASWFNWPRALRTFARLLLATSGPTGADEYLLSSRFRDLAPEMDAVARDVGVELPADARLVGARYFEPFAAAAVAVVERLR